MKIEQHMKGWYQSNLDVVFLFQGMSLEKHGFVCLPRDCRRSYVEKAKNPCNKLLEWVSRHFVTWHV